MIGQEMKMKKRRPPKREGDADGAATAAVG
jgi:hypothetical protein